MKRQSVVSKTKSGARPKGKAGSAGLDIHSPAEHRASASAEHIARREFSIATKKAAWERCGGQCEGRIIVDRWRGQVLSCRCLAPIDIGNFHYDHIDPSWVCGRNDLGNIQVLCVACHQAKTANIDIPKIAKIKRNIAKHAGKKKSKRPMRNDKLMRKLDGTVVDRKTGRPIWPKM